MQEGRSTSGTLLFLAYLKSPGSPRLFYLAATMGTLPASYSARGWPLRFKYCLRYSIQNGAIIQSIPKSGYTSSPIYTN